jgi:hypothetical protein
MHLLIKPGWMETIAMPAAMTVATPNLFFQFNPSECNS